MTRQLEHLFTHERPAVRDNTTGLDTLTFCIEQVHDDATLLLRALAARDAERAVLIAARLQGGLAQAERAAFVQAIQDLDHYDEVVTQVVRLQGEIRPLLDLLPRATENLVPIRRWLERFGSACLSRYRTVRGGPLCAPGEVLANLVLDRADFRHARLDDATLRAVTAPEADFTHAFAPGITMLHVDLQRCAARCANLEGSKVRDSCLAGASLTRAILSRAVLVRCDLRDAILQDVEIESATFVGCDLRGATFATRRVHVRAFGAHFIRCDLRNTQWGTRDLGGVRFEDCKLHGLGGEPRAIGLIVSRPDLSAAGDGSVIATIAEADVLWRRTT